MLGSERWTMCEWTGSYISVKIANLKKGRKNENDTECGGRAKIVKQIKSQSLVRWKFLFLNRIKYNSKTMTA